MGFDEFVDVLRAFDEHSVAYVLVGGVAINLHGVIRATEDIDFFIDPTAENIERLKSAFHAIYDDEEIDDFSIDDFLGKYSTVRYSPPGTEITIDLIARLGTRFAFEDLDAELIEVQGVRVRVATTETLIAMKSDTVRPIDKADVIALQSRRRDATDAPGED